MTLRPTQQELQVLGSALAAIAPPGWSAVRHVVRTVGPTTHTTTTATTPNGDVEIHERLDRDVRRLLTQLRTEMYRPGAGTWFTATFTVHSDGRITTDFDYDNEPEASFAPLSWAAEADRFPRSPVNTPAWLAAKAEQPDWVGARWQLEFTTDGAVLDRSQPLDGTTTDQGHAWSAEIAQQLRARGHDVEQRVDDGEDGQGNELQFDEVLVKIGSGYMALAFFRHEVFWTTEVRSSEVDQSSFSTLARDVLTIVRTVTGYDIGDQPGPYERRLLGLSA